MPEFWSTILKNNTRIAEIVTEDDDAALSNLIDIELKYLENGLVTKTDNILGISTIIPFQKQWIF